MEEIKFYRAYLSICILLQTGRIFATVDNIDTGYYFELQWISRLDETSGNRKYSFSLWMNYMNIAYNWHKFLKNFSLCEQVFLWKIVRSYYYLK